MTDPRTPLEIIEERLDDLFARCQSHAKHCRRCFMPIMDEEGNPGLFGEACTSGYQLLTAYVDAEKEYLELTKGEVVQRCGRQR
jgi:hypothetical protein